MRRKRQITRAYVQWEWVMPTPAGIARDRLRWCIHHDREACGDGRWVRVYFLDAFLAMAIANAAIAGVSGCASLLKPHYRWEPRP